MTIVEKVALMPEGPEKTEAMQLLEKDFTNESGETFLDALCRIGWLLQ